MPPEFNGSCLFGLDLFFFLDWNAIPAQKCICTNFTINRRMRQKLQFPFEHRI